MNYELIDTLVRRIKYYTERIQKYSMVAVWKQKRPRHCNILYVHRKAVTEAKKGVKWNIRLISA